MIYGLCFDLRVDMWVSHFWIPSDTLRLKYILELNLFFLNLYFYIMTFIHLDDFVLDCYVGFKIVK